MVNEKIVEQARKADVIAFLEKHHGFTFTHRGSAYRCHQHPSLAVKDDRLSWYWHSQGIGGHGVIDYLVKMENLPFRQAVEAVARIASATAPPQQEQKHPKTLFLPEKRWNAFRLHDYLCQKRGIDIRIVNTLMEEEKLYEDKRGNVVFVGFDEQGEARFASLRGMHSDFRMDCAGSDKRYGFNMPACASSERLYVFESAIDAMSHASLENAVTGNTWAWREHSRLSLAGTSDVALPFFLNQHPVVRELVLCLDNDPAGRDASVALVRKYIDKGFHARIELPSGKDFNEDLQTRIKQVKAERRAKPLHRDVDVLA